MLLFLVGDARYFVTHRLPLGVAARAAGFDVHVCTPYEPASVALLRDAGLTHHDISLGRGVRGPLVEVASLLALRALVRRLRPDLLHAVALKPVLLAGLAARLDGVPALVQAVTGLGWLYSDTGRRAALGRRLAERLFRSALEHPNGLVLFQNPDDQRYFLDRAFVEPRRSRLIGGCGVDLARFSPVEPAPGPPVVLFPARILVHKGAREFVEAARRLRAEWIDARFVLAGPLDVENPGCVRRRELEGWVREGAVEWWGPRDDMPAVLGRAHIVCLPSYYREGVPKVLLEAAACGRAIVTTDVPGCRDTLRDGETGLLVPPRDLGALLGALRRLIGDEPARVEMGRAGRVLAERAFGVARFVARSLAIYEELLVPVQPRG